MAFDTRSGVHFGSGPSLICWRNRNSVGAPKLTPIIWPAQPPSILSCRTAKEISRVPFDSRPIIRNKLAVTRHTTISSVENSARRIREMVSGVEWDRRPRCIRAFACLAAGNLQQLAECLSQLWESKPVSTRLGGLRQHALA